MAIPSFACSPVGGGGLTGFELLRTRLLQTSVRSFLCGQVFLFSWVGSISAGLGGGEWAQTPEAGVRPGSPEGRPHGQPSRCVCIPLVMSSGPVWRALQSPWDLHVHFLGWVGVTQRVLEIGVDGICWDKCESRRCPAVRRLSTPEREGQPMDWVLARQAGALLGGLAGVLSEKALQSGD